MNEREIYVGALEKSSAAERAAFLDGACGGDEATRRRLDDLFREENGLGSFLESPPAALVSAEIPTVAYQPPEGVGAVVGPYRLLEQIGEGGMGSVYVAEQTHPVRRRVALKVIKPGMDTRQVLARFEAERQALALMDHPNIAKVHDAGATASGRPYFAMELVKGIPITDYCDKARLSIPERLELFVLVCRAVQHAHQKGVIHRDLKPSNILVTLIDGAAVPKVIDFGIAKTTGGPLTDRSIYTGFAQLVGTPLYMSPEQAELSGVDVDTRSDVYALGVLLYELLTGTTPIDREALGRAAYDEVRRVIREQDPPTPSTRLGTLGATLTVVSANRHADARGLGHAVRGELDWIVMKALEKDRTRRYETASDIAADVMRHLTNQPVAARPSSRTYHLQKFVRRNRGRVAAVGLISVLGLALAAAIGWQAVGRATREAETAGAVTQALDAAERWVRLAKWPEALAAVKRAEALLGTGGGGEALRRRARELGDDLAMVSRLDEIRLKMTAVKDNAFDTGLGDRMYAEAFRNYGIDVESLGPGDVASRMPAGAVREELVASLDDWARVRREEHGDDHPGWKSLVAAARVADPDPWRDCIREAWMRGDRDALGDLASSAPLDRLHPCSVILLQANLEADRAVAVLREAQQRRPGDFWLNQLLAKRLLLEMQPSRADEAVGFFRASLALRPQNPGATLNLAYALKAAGRVDEAIAAYEQAIRLKPDYATAHSNLGAALMDQGRVDEAIVACREAIRLNPTSSAAQNNLGWALTVKGSPDEAIAAYREALRLEPSSSLAPYNLGNVCHEMGELDEAIAAFRVAIRNRPEYAEAHCNLGHCLRDRGQLHEALAALRRGHELGSGEPSWPYPSARWVDDCEALLRREAPPSRVEGAPSPRPGSPDPTEGRPADEPRDGDAI